MASTSTLTLDQPSGSTPYELDPETSILIARLTLDDIDEINGSRKGKSRDDAPLTDEEYAFQAQAESLRIFLAFLEDSIFAQSVDEALDSDQHYLNAVRVIERAAEDDRRAAFALSEGQPLPEKSASQRLLENPAFTLPSTSERGQSAPSEEESDEESRSSTPSPEPGSTRSQRIECVICSDDIKSTMNKCHAPCGHYYCRDCLVNLVEACTRDESLFPLRCCKQALPIRDVRPFLPLKIRALFLDKSAEFDTPSLSRIYCPNPTCSIFLGSSDASTRDIRCPRCATTVCLACKQRAHHGENCAESAMTLEVKALARSENWQTCPGCNAIIELDQGCHHMTCRCRTEFCYVCAARWKNCACPQWEEARLLGTAERRVVNELGVRAQAAAPDIFRERVRERVADLRVNHDCVNHQWRYRHGGGRCEECSYTLPQYLLLCGNCGMVACVRCSRNRL